jgi:prophage DNA circulation protein
MSGVLGGWLAQLRPASFGGYGFYYDVQKAKTGQRLIIHEMPYAAAQPEPSGPVTKAFTVTAYFIGSAWLSQREAFVKFLESSTGAATLVLPTKGPLTVMVGAVSYQDDNRLGNIGYVDFDVVVVPTASAAPFANADTASTLLNAITRVTAQIEAAYQTVMGPIAQEAAVAGYAVGLLESAASAVLALPQALLSGVAASFAAAPTNTLATAQAVTAAYLTISDNAVPVLNPAAAMPDPVSGTVPAAPAPADPSLGLAALAAWGETLPPPAATPASLGAAQAAITGRVQQSAAAAMVTLYAQTTFPNAGAAAAARSQIASVMASVAAGIFAAGLVDMYRAWCALTTMAINDMIARAQNLPQLAAYNAKAALPDVVLAQMFYQDGSQAPALFALNDGVHPLFMPQTGVWLEAA